MTEGRQERTRYKWIGINVNSYIWVCMHMHTFLRFFYLKNSEAKTTLGMSMPSAQILVSNIFSTKRNDGSLEKWLIKMWEQSRYNISVKYLVMPEIKEVFQKIAKICHQNISQLEGTLNWPKWGQVEKL